jgi:hypothetical protein
MNSKKLGISHPWYCRSIGGSITEELWIRNFVDGLFVNYNYLLSNLFVQVYPKKLNIKLLIFIRRKNPDWLYCLVYLPRLIKLIKSVLTLKYNKNISISFKVVGSVFEDEKILSTLLSRKVSKNAFKFRFTLKRVFDRFKQKGHKKNWEKVMSKYTGRRRKSRNSLSGLKRAKMISKLSSSKLKLLN